MYDFKLLPLKIFFTLLLASPVLSLQAQSGKLQRNWWFPNGPVNTIAADTIDNKIYIGGSFDMVGPAQPYGAVFSLSDSAIDPNSGIPDNSVNTSISDGVNGWFVAGKFQRIGDSLRPGLAHLNSKGQVTTLFTGKGGVNGTISVMYLKDSLLFIGGSFSSVLGIPRNNLACINIISGNTTSWAPDPDGAVLCFALYKNMLYMGGDFTSIGGVTRFRLASVNITTAQLGSWNPSTDATVKCIAEYKGRFYVAGNFTRVNGSSTASPIILIDTLAKTLTSPYISFASYTRINQLRIRNSVLYIGGDFRVYSQLDYTNIVAFDLVQNKILKWNPSPDGEVMILEFYKDQIIAGGKFIKCGTKRESRVAFIDTANGNITKYSCPTGGTVNTIALSDSAIYIGGEFYSIGGMVHHYIARFDPGNGRPDSWDPNATGSATKLVVIEDRIFVSGSVYIYYDQGYYSGLVTLNKKTGVPLKWKPLVNGTINDMLFYNSRLYLAGYFSTISAQNRNNIGCVDTSFGYAFNWAPNANAQVTTMNFYDGKIHAGGNFYKISGGAKGNCVAVLDPLTNGRDTSLSGNCNTQIIYTHNDKMYVGYYDNVVQLNPATGSTIGTWKPTVNGSVKAISDYQGAIILGGGFTKVGNNPRPYLAMVSGSTGALLPWNPSPDGQVTTVLSKNGLLFCGGVFNKIAKDLRQGFAVFKDTCGEIIYDTARVTACDVYHKNSVAYFASTTIKESGYNSDGCPRMLHTLLTIKRKTPDSMVNLTGCREVWYGNQKFTNAGTYVLSYKNIAGCDSNIIIYANVVKRDTRIYHLRPTELATYASPATYQWFVCDSNFTLIPGATDQTFKPEKSGDYGVFIYYLNCRDTSSCLNVNINGIDSKTDVQNKLYPNPTSGLVTLEFTGNMHISEMRLMNSVGIHQPVSFEKSNDKVVLDLDTLPPGTYFLQVHTSRGVLRYPVIKN